MSDTLQKICADTRAHLDQARAGMPFAAMDAEARLAPPPRGFEAVLRRKAGRDGVALITEIKKASPSAGLIRPDFDPASLALSYEKGGAACLSVLTDAPYFQGSPEHLKTARAACALPVLRKDFMLDVWQVAEARAMGADCILIIMAAVDDALALDLHAAATGYGMDALIESHDGAELERALRLPSGLIGINNRDLKTLRTSSGTTEELARMVPPERLLVSESGIATAADVTRLRACGARAFLVGESLLKQPDPGAAARALLAYNQDEPLNSR